MTFGKMTISVGDIGESDYTPIANLVDDATLGERTVEDVAVDYHAVDYTTHFPGRQNTGEYTFTIEYDEEDSATVETLLGKMKEYIFVLANINKGWLVTGYMSKFGTPAPLKGLVKNTISIMPKVTPEPYTPDSN